MKQLQGLTVILFFACTLLAKPTDHFKVITLQSEQGVSKSTVQAIANPFSAQLSGHTLSLDGLPVGNVALRIVSMDGQIISSSASVFTGSPLSLELPTSIAPGVYSLRVNSSSRAFSQKISVK